MISPLTKPFIEGVTWCDMSIPHPTVSARCFVPLLLEACAFDHGWGIPAGVQNGEGIPPVSPNHGCVRVKDPNEPTQLFISVYK